MNKGKLTVGIIGYGKMGQHHAGVWRQIPGIEIVAISDPIPDLRSKALEEVKCKTFQDTDAMLLKASPDITIVTTHVSLHHKQSIRAFVHGSHVVCEKPMALTLRECDDMIETASHRNVILAIHHQYAFSRAVGEAQAIIDRGEIGDVYLIEAFGKGRIACSDLMEIGGHLVDIVRRISRSELISIRGQVRIGSRQITRSDARPIIEQYPEGRDSGIGAGDRIFGEYLFSNGIFGRLNLVQMKNPPSTYGENRQYGFYVVV